ncbi:MAG: DNA cytosine methyltransferase [Firmicutes bacterium]|nr:DNA cytosine methyltransferase [Bacillota bacterium]
MTRQWRHQLSCVELCAGAGGSALGLEMAGFGHVALVEIERDACDTLAANRPEWNVIAGDIRQINGREYRGVDLISAGVPCPPFSVAGKQLGPDDERDLFPDTLRIIEEARPNAVLIENVPGFASNKFADYRNRVVNRLHRMGYHVEWTVLQSSDYGVPQLRPRFVLVGIRTRRALLFRWPAALGSAPTVGAVLRDLMGEREWPGVELWAEFANDIAPTIVGGSKKHGGPDLGPTRAKEKWAKLHVDGMGIADTAPGPEFPLYGKPRLTVRMVARIQGFPDTWVFRGGKTSTYRQVGNAFPPPVARAVGLAVSTCLVGDDLATQLAVGGALVD